MKSNWDLLYKELVKVSKEILPYYDIDKVKSYAVYIWTKTENEDDSENVFDIMEDRIEFYDELHQIPNEVYPIIDKIQIAIKNLKGV